MNKKRILFIGGLFLERFVPFLRKNDAEIILIATRTDDSISEADQYIMNPKITASEIVSFIRENQISGVISKIDFDNEATFFRDSLVKEVVSKESIPFFGQGFKPAIISMDKSIQRSVFETFQIKMPKGGIANNWDEVQNIASMLTYPIILKKPISAVSQGIAYARTPDDLYTTYLNLDSKEVVVEQFISGYEIGLEAIIWNNQIQIHPSVFLGITSIENDPHTRFRICPFLSDEQQKKAESLIRKIVSVMDVEGILQVDTVYDPINDEFFVLEVNARFNGMSDLTSWASDINVFEDTINCVIGNWKCKIPKQKQVAVEIPIQMLPAEIDRYITNQPLIHHSRINCGKGLIHLSSYNPDKVLEFIRMLPDDVKLFNQGRFEEMFYKSLKLVL